jgi:FkbM family methyltransferase
MARSDIWEVLARGASPLRHLGVHRIQGVRRTGLWLLARGQGHDITIPHHWAPEYPIRLNSYRHRAYWFHARDREQALMESFRRLIRPGSTVIELGGHIGYVSVYLATLVGPSGRVFVFEPAPANLRYLEQNTAALPQVEIVRAAATDVSGPVSFFVEGLTGMNSTLVPDYEIFTKNAQTAFSNERYERIEVEAVTVDQFIVDRGIAPDFIKIDIEGAELSALRGMTTYLAEHRPVLMVEVTNDEEIVMQHLDDLGYRTYDDHLRPVEEGRDPGLNRFMLPSDPNHGSDGTQPHAVAIEGGRDHE